MSPSSLDTQLYIVVGGYILVKRGHRHQLRLPEINLSRSLNFSDCRVTLHCIFRAKGAPPVGKHMLGDTPLPFSSAFLSPLGNLLQ